MFGKEIGEDITWYEKAVGRHRDEVNRALIEFDCRGGVVDATEYFETAE
jgi:hypothetical protein